MLTKRSRASLTSPCCSFASLSDLTASAFAKVSVGVRREEKYRGKGGTRAQTLISSAERRFGAAEGRRACLPSQIERSIGEILSCLGNLKGVRHLGPQDKSNELLTGSFGLLGGLPPDF